MAAVLEQVAAGGRECPRIVIDGRSGVGKSAFAAALISRWPTSAGVHLVGLDNLYPGWAGLDRGACVARDRVLVPHHAGRIGTWQRWDWDADRYAEAYAVDPELPVIVEGSGILRPDTAELADVTVWLEGSEPFRKRRALARDGDTFVPHWDGWAAQEADHVAAHRPRELATLDVTVG